MALPIGQVEGPSGYIQHRDDIPDCEPCHICGKSVRNEKHFIHVCLCCNQLLRKDGEFCPKGMARYGEANIDMADANSGWFPVGSDCIKRVPKEYRYTKKELEELIA